MRAPHGAHKHLAWLLLGALSFSAVVELQERSLQAVCNGPVATLLLRSQTSHDALLHAQIQILQTDLRESRALT